MDLQLDNQVAFIAGSSRGIGRAIAATLLAQGARVILTGRDSGSLEAAREGFETAQNRSHIMTICGDFSVSSVIVAGFERAVAQFGSIDHLIANLGTGSGDPEWNPPDAEWERLFEQNFFAATRLTQAVIPHLLTNDNGGSILYLSSIVALEATSAPLPYCAAKAALENYSKNLARRFGAQKIRVNTIAPGNIKFPGGSWQEKLDDRPERVNAMLKTDVPLQRFGSAEEVASLAAYLCSGHAGFCTGGCYVMDGGQTRAV